MSRPKLGIVIDYSVRIPEFKDSFVKFKEQVIVGLSAGQHLDQEDLVDANSFWAKAVKENPAVAEFYMKQVIPAGNSGKDFDPTLKKYFMTNEHRLKFIEEWSYNLYGQTTSIANKADINVINTAQSKLCDIVLIDRCTNTRKVANTFAFMARSGLFIKQIIFTNTEDELVEVKKDLVACWDPFTDPKQMIEGGAKFSVPTKALMDWFMQQEKEIKKIK
jgi:hypothetical protein